MIFSMNQPYFCPYPGFFLKAQRSDILVLLDSVQFPRGTTWITRNRFKNDQGTLWLTVPVWKRGLGLQRIDEVRICHEGRWVKKHLESLRSAYGNAPYLDDHMGFLLRVYETRFERLVQLNGEILRYLLEQLQVRSRIVLLSELDIDARGEKLPIAIARALGASQFLTQKSAVKFLNADLLEAEGIALQTFNPPTPVYPQLWGDFLPDLSTFDLLFNCGPKTREILQRP